MFALDTDSVLRLVQITDTHLHGDADSQLVGINTWCSLKSVLDLIRQTHTPDAMLVTGDISQDCSLEAYLHLHEALESFDYPKFWLKGNHDYRAHFEHISTQHNYAQTLIRTPHWQIILLDSQVEGAVFGQLAPEQLSLLNQYLDQRPDLHTLISFHHHPLPMHSQWLDKIGLKNAAEFSTLISKHNNVRAVLWGHVHQASDRTENGVRYLSTPSTCVQFKPHSEQFAVDSIAPGYRWLELHADGQITTGIERVAATEFLPDVKVNGY